MMCRKLPTGFCQCLQYDVHRVCLPSLWLRTKPELILLSCCLAQAPEVDHSTFLTLLAVRSWRRVVSGELTNSTSSRLLDQRSSEIGFSVPWSLVDLESSITHKKCLPGSCASPKIVDPNLWEFRIIREWESEQAIWQIMKIDTDKSLVRTEWSLEGNAQVKIPLHSYLVIRPLWHFFSVTFTPCIIKWWALLVLQSHIFDSEVTSISQVRPSHF